MTSDLREFKGTGNMESVWTALADKRMFPAINIGARAPARRSA
jgi:transcription termination factor Rho